MLYSLYKIVNSINGKYYIGVHKSSDHNDDYMGSGKAIKRAIAKYGIQHFTKLILETYEDQESAYKAERNLVAEVLGDVDCYNIMPGGVGSWEYVNSLGLPNAMKNPEIVAKLMETKRVNNSYYTESAKAAQLKNLDKAKESWIGSSHTTETKTAIGENSKKTWADNRTKMLDSLRTVRNSFTLESPDGIIHEIPSGGLNQWCLRMGLAVSAFSTKKAGYVIKRGRAKDWKILDRTH